MTVSAKPMVFFIDDDPLSNKFNTMLIRKIHPDVEIKTFTKAEEALADLKEASNQKPEVIFLDLNMPVMNGWDFMAEFKKIGLDIEVVVLTSSNDSVDKEKAEKNKQIKDYVVKPLTKNTFTGVVKKFFRNKDEE
jgi:response regulator RpfG family c-di-GMP phosphodiesterase